MLKTVRTENGLVKGVSGNNARISVFKGIPFAAPSVGENRWRAPQPCADWEGVLDCSRFAPISVQDTPGLGTDIYCREWHVDPEIPMNEDCLYLNVWTNAKSDTDKLPVLVWFFGGAFQWGYTPEMELNGEGIAKRGVVVVSVNYRLAALGFLAHPDLTKENDGITNFGNLDQLEGLKWVKRNIAAFGGDPDNVTIMGQSAGGASVLAHVTSPASKGYFNRAIILSGMIRSPYHFDPLITPQPLSVMEELGVEFLRYLGVETIEEARKLDAFFIRDKYGEFANSHPRFAPCFDGSLILDDPYKMLMSGRHNNVPILCGNTTDEFVDCIFTKDETLEEAALRMFGDKKDEFLAFPETKIKTDFGCAPINIIEASTKAICEEYSEPIYYYSFDPDIPGEDNPGTFHSVDLWFFFETLGVASRPFVGRHFDLARQMCNYITNFMKNGNPNGKDCDGTDMPLWKPYTKAEKNEMIFTGEGCKTDVHTSDYVSFLMNHIIKYSKIAKKQAYNPYLPSHEYIPDGEPYVFDGRVYVYGSHDNFNGHAFCLNDYVCWSAPVDDLGNWRYEGVTYTRTDDPENSKNNMCLYAPDVTVGPDGRYYLFYVLDKISIVSVAVCDTPAGKYEFLGYVHYPDGTRLGEKDGDEPQFDPGVITIGDKTHLYTGFCGMGDKSRSGAMVTVLEKDMLTILEAPKIIVPGSCYSAGTEYEGHAFFEAPSIRCFDNKYYFIYSSEVMHELCYATSESPLGPFTYGGVIVSNSDMHIDSYKPADKPTAYGANNHGSLIEIAGKRYIFYHRQTHNSWYSRQGCAEPVTFLPDGSIKQAEITSCGLNGGPLTDTEEVPAYIACNLFNSKNEIYIGGHNVPRVTQEGRDGDEGLSYIACIQDDTNIGFKYFDCKGVTGISLKVRGYANGCFEVRTSISGEVLATIPVDFTTVYTDYSAECKIPDGVQAIYLKYVGGGTAELKSFQFIH